MYLLILKINSLNLTSNYCIMMTAASVSYPHYWILSSYWNIITHKITHIISNLTVFFYSNFLCIMALSGKH